VVFRVSESRLPSECFERNPIHIRQSCWEGRIQTVKTKGSKNSIPMKSAARAKLMEYLPSHKRDLLFVNRNGRPYSRDKVVSKVLHPMLKKLGINHKGRRCGLQAFRHGLASLLLSMASAKIA
jgi:integrase